MRFRLILYLFPLLFFGNAFAQPGCEPERPKVKRWILGFGNTADIYNGLHFGFKNSKTHTNGIDIGMLMQYGDKERATSANGIMLGLLGSEADTVRGFGYGTFWTDNYVVDGINFSPCVSVADSVNGISLAGLVSVVHTDLKGIALAPIVVRSENEMHGLGASLFVTSVSDNMYGLFIGGLYAGCRSDAKGFLLSALMTNASYMKGGQVSLINFAGDQRGLQLGLANFNEGGSTTLQLGGFNFGSLNEEMAAWYSNGLQVGVYNHHRHFRGLQLGLINHSRNMGGVQLGLINIISHNPAWCRVLPLVNISRYTYTANHRRTLARLPKIPGSEIVKIIQGEDTVLEKQMLNGKLHGITRQYIRDQVQYEMHYSHDTLTKTIWYTDAEQSDNYGLKDISTLEDDINNYVITIRDEKGLKSYQLHQGDTVSRTINRMKEGMWKQPANNDAIWIQNYRHDTLLEEYYRYTGKEHTFSDPLFGQATLKPNDHIEAFNLTASSNPKPHFAFGYISGVGNVIYYVLSGRQGPLNGIWAFAFKTGKDSRLHDITLYNKDSIVYMNAQRQVTEIITQRGWIRYYPAAGSVSREMKKSPSGKKHTRYDMTGKVTFEEHCDSLYLLKDEVRYISMTDSMRRADSIEARRKGEYYYRTSAFGVGLKAVRMDTSGFLTATEYYPDGKVKAYFLWKGNYLKQGKLFWPNGQTKVESFAKGKTNYMVFYHYKQNGTLHKVKEEYGYGPLTQTLKLSALKPPYRGANCTY